MERRRTFLGTPQCTLHRHSADCIPLAKTFEQNPGESLILKSDLGAHALDLACLHRRPLAGC